MYKFIQTIIYLCMICLTGLPALGQQGLKPNPEGGQNIGLFVDYANFPYLEDENTETELYFGWWTNNLKYLSEGNPPREVAYVEVLVEVYQDTSDVIINSQKWFKKVPKGLQAAIFKGYLLLNPGRYKMKATIRDINSNVTGVVNRRLIINDFYNSDELMISDIEFGLKLERAKEKSIWEKNGYMVIPNPNRAYDFADPESRILKIYAEVINLEYSPDTPTTFTTLYSIKDQLGNTIKSYGPYTEKKPGPNCVMAKKFSIATLKDGTYTFSIKVTDDFSGQSFEQTREFRMIRPAKTTEAVVSFSEKDAEEFLNIVNYIITENERVAFDELDLNGKIEFIRQFWKKRDTTPETLENEFQREHMRRWYATRQFDRPKVKGWETDMGRVYILHGSPDEVEDFQDDPGYHPYQIWHYYEERMEFYFADMRGTGVYRLMSEKNPDNTGVYDPDWKNKIKITRAVEFK